MDSFLQFIKKFIPKRIFGFFQPYYHLALAYLGAVVYRHPSRELKVVAVTGTKGKSSTVELINKLLEDSGYQTAVMGTIRFKVADEEKPNLYKMSMPGRFFVQRFLRRAVDAGCQYAIIEMTSEGAKLSRHKFIEMDTLIFTNLAPEHIESHGSFENYLKCKLLIRDQLDVSIKEPTYIIANRDDEYADRFLDVIMPEKLTYGLEDAKPYATNERGVLITYKGVSIHSPLVGVFNIYNILAAITYVETQGVPLDKMKKILETYDEIKGRAQKIECGQSFTAVVDYAHTAESLEALYQAFPGNKICVLGNTGGGRDVWKRPKMAEMADKYCSSIYLTNEDPYDEDPLVILEEMKVGITRQVPQVILDRREAIHAALAGASDKDTVLITGKGTDPYIMGPNNTKQKWSDAKVVEEELLKIKNQKSKIKM